jgi:hypothetical protein
MLVALALVASRLPDTTALLPTNAEHGLPASLTVAAAQAAHYAAQSLSPATRLTYAKAGGGQRWAEAAGVIALPATPVVVGMYLTDRASTHAVASLGRRLAASVVRHRLAGHDLDMGCEPGLAAPTRILQGAAPLVFGLVLDRGGPIVALMLTTALTGISFLTMLLLKERTAR